MAGNHCNYCVSCVLLMADKSHVWRWFYARLIERKAHTLFCFAKTLASEYPSLIITENDQQIVSAQWIEEMTHPKTVESDRFRGMDYGYLWWIIDREKKIYSAIGNSGNVIYINPEQNIVVAVASYFKPTVFDRVDFIMEHIEPFISSL